MTTNHVARWRCDTCGHFDLIHTPKCIVADCQCTEWKKVEDPFK